MSEEEEKERAFQAGLRIAEQALSYGLQQVREAMEEPYSNLPSKPESFIKESEMPR